jgi:hypothetical protein
MRQVLIAAIFLVELALPRIAKAWTDGKGSWSATCHAVDTGVIHELPAYDTSLQRLSNDFYSDQSGDYILSAFLALGGNSLFQIVGLGGPLRRCRVGIYEYRKLGDRPFLFDGNRD